mmetsp:Transcript_44249/g.50927  ORF Transcript_44249/g.50927 Transcript_44249/m.50927 type:complete len:209 (+) Transcript_44249:301-927(+)
MESNTLNLGFSKHEISENFFFEDLRSNFNDLLKCIQMLNKLSTARTNLETKLRQKTPASHEQLDFILDSQQESFSRLLDAHELDKLQKMIRKVELQKLVIIEKAQNFLKKAFDKSTAANKLPMEHITELKHMGSTCENLLVGFLAEQGFIERLHSNQGNTQSHAGQMGAPLAVKKTALGSSFSASDGQSTASSDRGSPRRRARKGAKQ